MDSCRRTATTGIDSGSNGAAHEMMADNFREPPIEVMRWWRRAIGTCARADSGCVVDGVGMEVCA